MTASVLMLFVAAQALAAPAPFQRSRVESVPPRHCVMRWYGARYPATFAPGGGYRATGANVAWVGSWSYEPATRTLVIVERVEGGQAWSTYVIVVPRAGGELGTINGNVGFAFLPE